MAVSRSRQSWLRMSASAAPVVAGAVELARPRFVGVPLAGEQALLLQPAQQRVERVRVDREPVPRQRLEQRVAVVGVRRIAGRPARRSRAAAPAGASRAARLPYVTLYCVPHTIVNGTRSPSTPRRRLALSRPVREPSPSHHNGSGANVKVPGSGGKSWDERGRAGGAGQASNCSRMRTSLRPRAASSARSSSLAGTQVGHGTARRSSSMATKMVRQ